MRGYMQLDIRRISQNKKVGYKVNFMDDDGYAEHRARLFMMYHGYLSYSGTHGAGLTVDADGVTYDDWMSEFRPPRIDAHKYNTELCIPLVDGEQDWWFSHEFDNESESSISSAINPFNVIVERKLRDLAIRRILVHTHEVFIELDADDIADGTAVTIDNAFLSANHLLGIDGLRICGTYCVTKVSGNVYKYKTEHYCKLKKAIEISADCYTAVVWEVCYYDCGNVELNKVSNDTAAFQGVSLSATILPGDVLCIGNVLCRVVEVNGVIIVVSALMQGEHASARILYSPRTATKKIPVNWPTVTQNGSRKGVKSSAPVIILSNNLRDSQTVTVKPIMDTYVTKDNPDSLHANEPVIVCANGEHEAVACMQFAPNEIKAEGDDDNQPTASLRLFVEDMTYSEATILVYQMDADGWNTNMSYDELMSHVTQIPIGSAQLWNPLKRIDNTAEIPAGSTIEGNSYHEFVSIDIDSSIVQEWLSGTSSYMPSIAIKVVGDGDASVSFASLNATDLSHLPEMIFSAGESLTPEPFAITLSSSTVEPGQVVRITPEDVAAHNFGASIFSNIVEIGEVPSVIVSGNASYIDAVVPNGVSGNVNVIVYRKTNDTDVVQLTEEVSIFVNTDAFQRSIPLAKKLKPGIVNADLVSSSALYNRDMGYVNMTEVTDETSLIQNVYSILLTNPGERLFNQNFGTGIEQKLFKLGSEEDGIDLLKECIQQVHKYEPRVYIDGEQSSCQFDDSDNLYYLLLAVVLPSARTEMIRLPFKNRGRMV